MTYPSLSLVKYGKILILTGGQRSIMSRPGAGMRWNVIY